MNWLEALILGIIQGLTEYLPISSSGHLRIGQELFGLQNPDDLLTFTVLLHVATVFSTIVILWREIVWILKDLFTRQSWKSYNGLNSGTKYTINILISMIPVGIVGLLFKDKVEAFFGDGLLVVGICLFVTALLLAFAFFAKPRKKENITPLDAFIIGIAQAIAVLPGLSRSGSTIATGLLLGDQKEKLAQFSFLMVIPPILGEALLDIVKVIQGEAITTSIPTLSLIIGFVTAFIFGCIACKRMINIVRKGKLIYFAIYCALAGAVAIITSLI